MQNASLTTYVSVEHDYGVLSHCEEQSDIVSDSTCC